MAIARIILTQAVLAYMCTGELVNVALNKPASMSSRFKRYDGNLSAENAVNGNTTAVFPSIIHTDVNQSFAWWMVDLQTQVQDATVKIYFRTDYNKRRNGVKLYTSTNNITYPPSGGTPCHTFTNPVPDIDSVNCTGSWRYLMVHTTTSNSGILLDFGEVEVIECSGGTYGDSCGHLCESRHCLVLSDTCDHVTGACSVDGCMSGWNGTDCTLACTLSTYGANCMKPCSDRQCRTPSSSCNRETGQCPDGCQNGWIGVDCTTHAAFPNTDPDKLTVGVIGALIGVIVTIAVGAVVLICLVRHGRIEWKKSGDSRQSAEMSDLRNPQGSSCAAAENLQSTTANLYNDDYSVLDSTTKSETRVYDVLRDKDKEYQNV